MRSVYAPVNMLLFFALRLAYSTNDTAEIGQGERAIVHGCLRVPKLRDS